MNIKGVLYGIAAAPPYMKENKSGHIINVSSVAGHKVRPPGTIYAATKHAVRALSDGLRIEVKPYNIRTTVISAGAVATELPDSITEPAIAATVRKNYERAIPADSFARAVIFAMSQPDDVDVNEILFRPTSQEFQPLLLQLRKWKNQTIANQVVLVIVESISFSHFCQPSVQSTLIRLPQRDLG